MRQAKRDTSWKEIETEGKWQKEKHETNRFYRREKQGGTQKGKKKKKGRKSKDPTKRN